jgi:hypothetical protein
MFNFKRNTETNVENSFDAFQQPMNLNVSSFEVTSDKPLWNPKSFIIISALFSFLPAGIMYSINCKRLGFKQKGNKVIVFSILGFIATLIVFSFLPGNFGKYVGMGINGAIGAQLMREQLPMFNEHISRGGKKASLVMPIIMGIVLTGIILVPLIYASNIPESNLAFGDDEIYFTPNVKEAEVETLGEYLTEYEFFVNDGNIISLKFDKEPSDIYVVSVIVDKESIDNPEMLQGFSDFANDISKDAFEGAKVEIHLCGNRFNKLKVVNPQNLEV